MKKKRETIDIDIGSIITFQKENENQYKNVKTQIKMEILLIDKIYFGTQEQIKTEEMTYKNCNTKKNGFKFLRSRSQLEPHPFLLLFPFYSLRNHFPTSIVSLTQL